MKAALLIACAFITNARAQVSSYGVPIKDVKLPVELKNIILGADVPDFQGFFHNNRSVFAIRFDTAVTTLNDSVHFEYNHGKGLDWHLGQTTRFTFALIPIAVYLAPINGDTQRYTMHFTILITEDSSKYSGTAYCMGSINGPFIKSTNTFLNLEKWKSSLRVNGTYILFSDTATKNNWMKMFWSYERPQKRPDHSQTLKDELNPVQADPNYAGAFMVKQIVWPADAMFPPENWYVKP